jgi:hypothetical protein
MDAFAAAEFLVRRMYRRIDLAENMRFSAIAETEHPFAGDTWFWTDDNAKVLEFLARPELGTRYAAEVGQIIKFLRAMCRGPFIFRRISAPRLELAGQDGTATSYYHSLMHVRFDLSHGYIVAGLRFHDGRTADNLLLCANRVGFTHSGRPYSINVERAIDSVNAEHKNNTLILHHSGDIFFKPKWRTIRLGRIAYTYMINACSMIINVEVVLEVDPNANVSDVTLSIGHDHLSHGRDGVEYSEIFTDSQSSEAPRFVANEPARGILPAAGAAYYSIVQAEIAGFALAIHSVPREPGRLSYIETLVQKPGKLHFARARYRFDGPCRGARLTTAEAKMLTAGGFYHRVADYTQIMREAMSTKSTQEAALDFSLSYDYGVELNGFANYFYYLSIVNGSEKFKGDIRELFNFYLSVYFDMYINSHTDQKSTVFSRQLAFVILSVVTMYRCTGTDAYLRRLKQLCTVMFDFEKRFDDIAGAGVSGFMMGAHRQRSVFVDCHSAALLALTEASQHIGDSRFAAAIDRGLGCYCIETTKIDWHDGPHKIDTIAVDWIDDDGTRQTNHGYWNYHAGLTLRFFAALRRARDRDLQAVAGRHRQRIKLFEAIMRWNIQRSVSQHDDAIEIRSSVLSTETNSETQPWAMLGLLEQGWASSAAASSGLCPRE